MNNDDSMQRMGRRTKAELSEQLKVGREMLKRCEEREARFLQSALEASRDGDDEGVWLGMASRAENNRFMERLRRELLGLEAALAGAPSVASKRPARTS